MAAPGVARGQRGRKSPPHTPWGPDSVHVQVKAVWEPGGPPRSWEVTQRCLGRWRPFQARPRPRASPAMWPLVVSAPSGRGPRLQRWRRGFPGERWGTAGPSAHTWAVTTGGDLVLGDQRAEYLSAVSLRARGRGPLWAPKELPRLLFSPRWPWRPRAVALPGPACASGVFFLTQILFHRGEFGKMYFRSDKIY